MQFIDDYIARKKGLKKVEYAHLRCSSRSCAGTQGIMV